MLATLIKSNKLEWVSQYSLNSKRVALLIPQYNELSNGNFIERLDYFNRLADRYSDIIDVIIIDDGSVDKSLDVIREYSENNNMFFNIAGISPNAQKIGALYLTILNIRYEYILFSDFDTDLVNLEFLPESLSKLDSNISLMGCYFRMLPINESSMVNKYQRFEYALQRVWYKYTEKKGAVAVMPGACSLYKYGILKKLLGCHSGLRNGEDRETTAMGMKLGYEAVYQNKIFAYTRAPKTLNKLIVQRIRWNLGYLESVFKERKFYVGEISSYSVLGLRSSFDILSVLLLLVFPPLLILLGFIDFQVCMLVISVFYITKLLWVLLILLRANDTGKMKIVEYLPILVYPIFKVIVDYPSWLLAIYKFLNNDYGYTLLTKPMVKPNIKEILQKERPSSLNIRPKGMVVNVEKDEAM